MVSLWLHGCYSMTIYLAPFGCCYISCEFSIPSAFSIKKLNFFAALAFLIFYKRNIKWFSMFIYCDMALGARIFVTLFSSLPTSGVCIRKFYLFIQGGYYFNDSERLLGMTNTGIRRSLDNFWVVESAWNWSRNMSQIMLWITVML